LPWRLVGSYRLAPEPDGSPLFTSSPSVACQRYEPRKCPDPLAMARYRNAAFPVERSGRPLRSRSISGLTIRSLAFRPATFLSTLRSGCYQTPRKTRYAAAWLRLCRGRHPRRLNSTRLQGAIPSEPCVRVAPHTAQASAAGKRSPAARSTRSWFRLTGGLRHLSFGLFSLRCLTSPSVKASSFIAPLRPAGSLRPFGLGIPALAALSAPLQDGLRFLRHPLPPPPSPSLRSEYRRLPAGGTGWAYPVV
jgi:hypothetical protein